MPQMLAAVQVDHTLAARGSVIQRHPIGRVLLRANNRGLEAKRRRHRADHRPPQIHMPTLDVPQLVGQHKPDKLPILIRVAHVHKVGVDDNISAGHLAFRRICIHDPIPIFDIQPGQAGDPLPSSVGAEAHLLGKVMVDGVDLGELGWGHLHRVSDGAPIKPSDSEECERRGKNANQNPLAELAQRHADQNHKNAGDHRQDRQNPTKDQHWDLRPMAKLPDGGVGLRLGLELR